MNTNRSVLWRVFVKDWYMARWFTVGTLVLGAVALAIASLGPSGAYSAMILIIVALIMQGCMLTMYGVVTERKERATLFTLSLPISTVQHAAIRAVALITAYLFPCLILAAAGLILAGTSFIPAGLIPISVLTWLFLLDLFLVLLGVALTSDSEGWTVATLVVTNTSVSFFFYFVLKIPGVLSTLRGPVPVWSAAILEIVAVELAAIAIIAAVTLARLAR
ncbi:MAG: hypothetical protein ACREUG_00410, partial [Steroidobacteraceae bacterium]